MSGWSEPNYTEDGTGRDLRTKAEREREAELLRLEDHLERDHNIRTRSGGWRTYTAEPTRTHTYVHRHALGCGDQDEHVVVERMEHR